MSAFENWNSSEADDPPGWVRHLGTNRRRPGGDPTKEYTAP